MAAGGFDRAEARNVSKIYGRVRALHRVSLDLTPGRVTGLLGPNGAGKTTLLWLFSTLTTPSSGTMHFGDLDPVRAREARGHIGLLSHASLTYGDLTALENVTFYARLYGVEDPEGESRRLLEEFGLREALDRPAKTFSRGMTQRLGLARALVGRPSLVLLDEPFTGLDRASTRTVIQRIHHLREQGAMVLMISHDMETTAELADEIAILVRGKLTHRHQGRLDGDALRARYAEVAEGAGQAAQEASA
ncbi:MAG: ABC transporter ATP-binding protein [Myxococcales bacterium]|nr:ABC transporter ATP-binding protein [Myxococcales bacterium]MCB9646198.1 ABC transporter ATP-binding protein [Deltaproteobacteria bacterium]